MSERILYESDLFSIHAFECPPDDDAWRAVNVIESDAPLVVFPHARAVGIRRDDAPAVLATPNEAMLYNPGERFERRLVDESGDRCIYIALRPAARRLLERDCPTLAAGRLTEREAPLSAQTFVGHLRLLRNLRLPQRDVDELAARVVHDVLQPRARSTARRRSTAAAHRALAEAAKEVLASNVAEPHTLGALAGRLDVSPFHLARVFREETGFSVHRYLTQLRVRLALDRIPQSRGALAALAAELGFASHSHFADTFRRELGLAPSAA